jgi:hypothetical protein
MFSSSNFDKKFKAGQKPPSNLIVKKKKDEVEKPTNEQIATQNAMKAKENRNLAREEGVKYGEEFFNRPVAGLKPNQRNAMQFEAQKQIQRQMQGANRKLLGEQGRRGIMGNSGVAYAQQKDLQRVGNEAKNQSLRDIEKLDADLAMKKLAAMFNVGQGEAAQSQLDMQLAQDELRMEEDRKRQKRLEDMMYNQFSRV